MNSYDLHNHSIFSDGACSVEELIAIARKRELAGIGITDHDWLGQLSRVRTMARAEGFPVLAGIEVSAFNPATGRKVHVLGYGLEATPDESGPLERLVAPTRAARTANSLWQAWTLMRAGVTFRGNTVDLTKVAQVGQNSSSVFKQHIMWALTGLERNDPDYRMFYQKHFKNGGIAQRDIAYPSAIDAVHAIREQGGIAVLAHPGQMDSWALIPDLVKAGLQGIEAYHPDHIDDDVKRAKTAAQEYGLFITGGSDYHGVYGKPASLGVSRITDEEAGQAIADLYAREATLL
ncbi:MAG: PHP domain-containing protein [Eggerthellaceae bacterium]|jgi:predicted metal-dependent phosphoesterase TrpH